MSQKEIASVEGSQRQDASRSPRSATRRTTTRWPSCTKFGLGARDVQWIAVGADANGRAAALATGRADATLLTPPAYFRVEEAGFKVLGNLADHDDIFAVDDLPVEEEHRRGQSPAARAAHQGARRGHQALLRRQGVRGEGLSGLRQAGRRPTSSASTTATRRPTSSSVCPTCSPARSTSVIDQQTDPQLMAQMKGFDFRTVIDNSVVGRLVKEGFFQKLFGPGIKAEEDRKAEARVPLDGRFATAPITSAAFCGRRELLDARSESRAHARRARATSRTRHILRVLERQKDLGFRDLHRRRAAPPGVHERLLRIGRRPGQRRLDRARLEGRAPAAPGSGAPMLELTGLVVEQAPAEEAADRARSRTSSRGTARATSR